MTVTAHLRITIPDPGAWPDGIIWVGDARIGSAHDGVLVINPDAPAVWLPDGRLFVERDVKFDLSRPSPDVTARPGVVT